jgi:hypothetical protein
MASFLDGVLNRKAFSNNPPSYSYLSPNSSKSWFCLIGLTSTNFSYLLTWWILVASFSTKWREVVLSVYIGMGGCLCSILINVFLVGILWLESRNSAPIFASTANDITF